MAIENPPKAPESLVAMGRLHGLSDGVFAFALTLLVLDIRLPEDILAGNLAAWLLALGPRFFIYLISFIVIGGAWAAHQRMLGQIKAGDGLLVWFNLLSLIFVTLLPASATLLGRFPNTFVAIAAFAGDVALIQLGALWLWRHAASSGLIDASLDPRVVAGIGRRLGFCAFVFTASIGLALFNITAVFVVWIGVFVLIFTTDWLSWQQAINTRRETFPIQRDSRASVHIVHAAGSLQVKAAEASSDLLAGLFGGGVTASLERSPETTEIDLRVSKLQGFMSLRFPWVWGQGVMLDWSLALTDQIPLALKSRLREVRPIWICVSCASTNSFSRLEQALRS
jgi:uncharacterized membrane protein